MSMREKRSAYQGAGWRPRLGSMSEELSAGRCIWAPSRVDSEYKRLEAVMLHCPGRELARVGNPNAVQHLEKIDPAAIKKEYAAIASAFRGLGVAVHFLPRAFEGWPAKPNLMYVRDLFFNTREGAVVSRMASAVRAGEEKYASLALAGLGIPVVRTVSGRGLFEGADALWLDPKTVVCGVGNRTNAAGFAQLRAVLKPQGVSAVAVKLPRGVQHLLGLVSIVDARLALVRVELAPKSLTGLLSARRFAVVPVPETEETTGRQGMNVVAVAPRKIVMPKGCPALKRAYAAAGVTIAAEVEIGQLARGAGGLACATGILSRRA